MFRDIWGDYFFFFFLLTLVWDVCPWVSGSLKRMPGVLLYHFLDCSLDIESLTQPETHTSPFFFARLVDQGL